MRPFELFFIFATAAALLVIFRTGVSAKRLLFVALFPVALCFLQILLEGFRWQMAFACLALCSVIGQLARSASHDLPFYGVAGDAVAGNAGRGHGGTGNGGKSRIGSEKLCWSLLTASLLLLILVPIAQLPKPSGQYAVGTHFYHLIDSNRREIFSADATRQRELMIQVWYPAESASSGKIAPFMADSSDLSPFLANPIFAVLASHLHLIPTHSVLNAPVAMNEPSYPVLIFSHGLLGGRIQNTVQAEALASNGFIVASIDHTYDCAFAIFPEHTICSQLVTQTPSTVPTIQEQGMNVRVQDVELVLDRLQSLNSNDPSKLLTGRLDLERLGVYGHSLGGQTAMLVCAKDKRFKAGLSMDGFANISPSQLSQPFMVMQADRKGDPFGADEFCRHLSNTHYNLKLKGAEHANFTDLPLITPLHWLIFMSGPIDGLRAMTVIDAYTVKFFEQQFKQKPDVFLDGPSRAFPEIIFER